MPEERQMAVQTLTPTPFVADGPGLDLTALLAAATGVTLQFSNTGREILLLAASSGSPTAQVNIGTTVLGQAISSFTAVTLTTHVIAFGPFHTIVDQTGSLAGSVQVTLSATANVTVALVSTIGVY
jgi:hypothetical protein